MPWMLTAICSALSWIWRRRNVTSCLHWSSFTRLWAAAGNNNNSAAEEVTVKINRTDTAVVFIDPQNEVLTDKGLAWKFVGQSVTENKTVENMERIFKAAKEKEYEVFISPHYFFPSDSGWKFNGPLETDEAETKMFARSGRLSLDGFSGS